MASRENVLKQVFQKDSKCYGQKNKPRNDEPSMFALLTWDAPTDEPWDFKKNLPHNESEASKYGARINHEKDNQWLTENRDNFRKIQKLEDGIAVQQLNDKTLKNISQCICSQGQTLKQQQNHTVECQQHYDYKLQSDWNPKIQSAYREQYQVKDIRTHNELMQQLENNAHKFKGHYQNNHDGGFHYDEPHPEEVIQEIDSVTSSEEYEGPEEVKKMNTKFNKSAKYLDPDDPEDREKLQRRLDRIKKFDGQTRWLPDSAFTTYFGKPAWGAYGQGNINPTVGGIVYGQHMLSHNIQPHRNKDPEYVQSYNNALRYSVNVAHLEPQPPRNCREEDRLNPEQIDALKKRNPLTATKFDDAKQQISTSKGRSQMPQGLNIKKPDLVNSLRFASEQGSVQGEPQQQQPQQQAPKKQHKKQPSKGQQATVQPVQNQQVVIQPIQNPQVKQETKDSKKSVKDKKEKRPHSAMSKPLQEQNGQKKHTQNTTDRRSEKKQDIEKKVAFDDHLAIPDKASNKFMDELKQKKEKSNRLTAKVNEINPSLLVSAPKLQNPSQMSKDLQEVKSFDAMNPPPHYLQNMDPAELNPKNYRGVPADWMQRIPYAGKTKEKDIPAKDCLDFGY